MAGRLLLLHVRVSCMDEQDRRGIANREALPATGDRTNSGSSGFASGAADARGGAKRHRWDAAEKVAIVLESFQSRKPNIEICRQYDISEPSLYKWRNLFVDGGKMLLESGGRSRLSAISAQNQQLRDALAELAIVNRRLRTRHLKSARHAGSPVVTDLFRDVRGEQVPKPGTTSKR